MAELRLVKTLWGLDEAADPSTWKVVFKSIKDEGYSAVEVIALAWKGKDQPTLIAAANHAGLAVVCQVHTAGGYIEGGAYIYCSSMEMTDHKASFSAQVEECKSVISQVSAGGFINSHSGIDCWGLEECVEFLTFALQEEARLRVKVTHETHRQRIFFNPFLTRDILSHPAIASSSLKLNADLSHWCCACERVFDPEREPRDKWWPATLALVASRAEYVHCRFGWAQGPQIADPSAKEASREVELQLEWWATLWGKQLPSGQVWCSPEFGPPPYMPCLPHTQEPVASLAAAVAWTKGQIEGRFARGSL